jgi:hypothetical protein
MEIAAVGAAAPIGARPLKRGKHQARLATNFSMALSITFRTGTPSLSALREAFA